MKTEKIGDLIWNTVATGLGLVIQRPLEVVKYTQPGVVKINGRERPDLPNQWGVGFKYVMETGRPAHVVYGKNSVRRMIVFK